MVISNHQPIHGEVMMPTLGVMLAMQALMQEKALQVSGTGYPPSSIEVH